MRIASKLHHVVFMMEKFADHTLIAQLDVSFMQVMILMHLKHIPTMSQKELAQRMGVTAGAISRQVDILSRRGLLDRNVRADNRREHAVTMTPAGENLVKEAISVLQTELGVLFADIDSNTKSQFEGVLTQLVTKLDPDCIS